MAAVKLSLILTVTLAVTVPVIRSSDTETCHILQKRSVNFLWIRFRHQYCMFVSFLNKQCRKCSCRMLAVHPFSIIWGKLTGFMLCACCGSITVQNVKKMHAVCLQCNHSKKRVELMQCAPAVQLFNIMRIGLMRGALAVVQLFLY